MATLNDLTSDNSFVCRGCLIECGEMKNMAEHNLIHDFYMFSGIKVNGVSGLTDFLCASCEGILLQCKRFRALCQHSDYILKRNFKSKEGIEIGKDEIETKESIKNSIVYNLYEKKLVIAITAPDRESKIILSCPYQCSEKFTKKSDLYNHMLRKHIADNDYCIELQYHCSIADCVYNLKSDRRKHFTGRKFLNQHYNKVHRNKSITCDMCKLNFTSDGEFDRHFKTCSYTYECHNCNKSYKTNERLLVHLMRHHPLLHQQYKNERKAEKRKSKLNSDAKKFKVETGYTCASPKRSSSTQTLNLVENIKNDVALPSWPEKNDMYGAKTDEISTQTVFEDLLSLKSQASEEDSMYFSETVSLSDIQTQTFPVEFGLSRCNKQTITSETQSPDLSMKETQTCLCLYDSPKFSCRLFDSVASSPLMNLTSTETQTASLGTIDAILGFNTAETQTSFEDNLDEGL